MKNTAEVLDAAKKQLFEKSKTPPPVLCRMKNTAGVLDANQALESTWLSRANSTLPPAFSSLAGDGAHAAPTKRLKANVEQPTLDIGSLDNKRLRRSHYG